MSGKIMGAIWDLDLPHSKQLIMLAMADHADHKGENVFASVGLIAWKTGYSERQAQRIIHECEEDGLLKVVTPASPRMSATYRIDLTAGRRKPEYQGRQNVTPPKTEGRQNVTPEVTQLCHPRGDIAMSPEPSDQPSIKPSESVPSLTDVREETRGGTLADDFEEGYRPSKELAAVQEKQAVQNLSDAIREHDRSLCKSCQVSPVWAADKDYCMACEDRLFHAAPFLSSQQATDKVIDVQAKTTPSESGEGPTPLEGWRDVGTVQDHRLSNHFPYTRYYIYDRKHCVAFGKPFKRVWDAHGSEAWTTALRYCGGDQQHLGVRTGQRLRGHDTRHYRLWLPEDVAEARPWYIFRVVDGKNVYTGPAPSKADAERLAAGTGALTQHMPVGAQWEPWPGEPKHPRKSTPLTPLQLAIGRRLLKQPNDATIDANKPRVNKLQRLILTCEGYGEGEMPSAVQSYLLADCLVADFIPWYQDEFRQRYNKDGDLPSGEDTLPRWYGEWIGLGKPGAAAATPGGVKSPKTNDPACPQCGGTGLVDWFQGPGEPARHAEPGELVSYSTPCPCGKGKAA